MRIGDAIVRCCDLRSGVQSRPPDGRVLPSVSCPHLCCHASVTKQFDTVVKLGGKHAALVPCPWSCSLGWCLGEGHGIRDQRR